MGCSSFHTKNYPMSVPHLYRQLQAQVSQWIHPQDQRHLQVFCENVAAIWGKVRSRGSSRVRFKRHRSPLP